LSFYTYLTCFYHLEALPPMDKKFFTLFFVLFCSGICGYTREGNIDFVENRGQFPQQVLYKAALPGGAVFLTADGFMYNYYSEQDLERIHEMKHELQEVEEEMIRQHAFSVRFAGGNPVTATGASGKLPYYHNYFLGNDPSHWAAAVPLYEQVKLLDIYKGIELAVYSKGTSMKYDFILQPGADAALIELQFDGVRPELLKNGNLKVKTSVNTIIEEAPYAYQRIDGKEKAVSCRYKMLPGNKIGFELPDGYNKAYPLVIDPVLVFSTFSGSTASTFGFSATYDNNGSLYAGGGCFDVGWPVTTGAFQTVFGNASDAAINKYSPDGANLLYSTYYGGAGSDYPNNMMVNASGQLLLSGATTSSNLPLLPGSYDNSLGGTRDIYVARFSHDGTALLGATYLGGSGTDGFNVVQLSGNYGDQNRGEVLADSAGAIYIAGSSSSPDFPVTAGTFQSVLGGTQDGILCKLDSNLSTLLYSTYLGGSDLDACFSIVLNGNNEMVVCGGTTSNNFPTTPGALHPVFQGGSTDGFAAIVNPSTGLVHATYLGTAVYDHAFKIQIDPDDNVYVCGQTDGDYPISAGVYNIPGGDIFIDKLAPDLSSSLLTTRLGNPSGTRFVPTAFLYDICGNTYLCGFRASSSLPVTANAFQAAQGGFWLGALGTDFGALLYATFMGGIGDHVDGGSSRFDPQGIVYHSVCTANPAFPTTAGCWSPNNQTLNFDIASFKYDMEVGAVSAGFHLANNANDTGCAPYTLGFVNTSHSATNYYWDFGDGATSTLEEPTHTFAPGHYTITLIASGPTGCILVDTASMNIVVREYIAPVFTLNDTFLCDPGLFDITVAVNNINTPLAFHWEPVSAITSSPDMQTVQVNPALSNIFTVHITSALATACVDSASGSVHVSLFDYSGMTALPADTSICPGDTLLLRAFGGSRYTWSPEERINNPNGAFTNVWPDGDITYKVMIESDSGCKVERSVNVHTLPPITIDAGRDRDIRYGEAINLDARCSSAFYWSPPDGMSPVNSLTPEVRPLKTTTYYIYANSAEGCAAMDSVTVHVTNAVLPSAFSPNGDGKNDVFKLLPFDGRVSLKDFSVYNRYGQRVFFTESIDNGWDGTFKGKTADMSTYFYYVRFIIGEKTYTIKGDVTLLR
jgi:gliding motility-associated-like protein